MNENNIMSELKDIKSTLTLLARSQNTNWKDVKGIAEYLNLSQSQIRKQVRENTIPYIRVNPTDNNSKLLFNTKLVNACLLSGNTKPTRKELHKIEEYI